jgi:PKD repeat protein
LGSDDLSFKWFWDDATTDTITTYFNDGIGPDPYPSPGGIYPVTQFDKQGHIFTASGNYDVELTVADDDGGASIVVITVILI